MTRRYSRCVAGMLIASACAAAGACASAPPVPLRGSPAAVAALAGEWSGRYSSRDTGRSGSIWFKLIGGEDHAHGDVLMTPVDAVSPYGRYVPRTAGPVQQGPVSQFLTIRFAAVRHAEIRGELERYWDPACSCEAFTTFHGRLTGDRLQGTFFTRFADGGRASGQWDVSRNGSRDGKSDFIPGN